MLLLTADNRKSQARFHLTTTIDFRGTRFFPISSPGLNKLWKYTPVTMAQQPTVLIPCPFLFQQPSISETLTGHSMRLSVYCPSSSSRLTLAGRLGAYHTGPRHFLSIVQDAPATVLGQVTLHWREAPALHLTNWGVARANFLAQGSTLENITEARACTEAREGKHALMFAPNFATSLLGIPTTPGQQLVGFQGSRLSLSPIAYREGLRTSQGFSKISN